MAELLREFGCECFSKAKKPIADMLAQTRLLIIPTPTGAYHPSRQCWRRELSSLFDPDEICQILGFVHDGGRLLAFGYRFGDSFTQTNLGILFASLGCLLNDDAIVDLRRLQNSDPLQSMFETTPDLLPVPWASEHANPVEWRSMATLTILPTAVAQPLAYSPGGNCVSFDRTFRQISAHSMPIAVVGIYGQGRFALFGGPHAFETGPFGLLHQPGNTPFLKNLLHWLLSEQSNEFPGSCSISQNREFQLKEAADRRWQEFNRIRGLGRGEETIGLVERLLRESGTLKAISKARWDP